MPWTCIFVRDDVGSPEGVATVTFVDTDVFADRPFVFSHRVKLETEITTKTSRLRAEIEAARDKEAARRAAIVTDSTAMATLLALKERV